MQGLHQDRDHLRYLVPGTTVGTSQEAVQRGYKVIVPVDCSAGESVYHEAIRGISAR